MTPTTSAKKAPGTVTVGIDKLGKHYMYVTGGGPGRHELNINQKQREGLARLGLSGPGKEIQVGSGVLHSLGVSGGSPTTGNAKPTPRNAGLVKKLASKIIASHQQWVRSGNIKGETATIDRLHQLFEKGRDEWLKQGNKSDAHKAFAATVLGTIFNRGVNIGKSGGKFRVTFNPGGKDGGGHITLKTHEGKELGGVKFNDITKIKSSDILTIRNHFGKLRGSGSNQASSTKAESKDTPKAREVAAIKKIFEAAKVGIELK